MKQQLIVILKGIWIGGTLTVPGVSGGSMAMILGIYGRLIKSVNTFLLGKKDRKSAFSFLMSFSIGALIGIFVLSGVVVWALEIFPTPVLFFFAGVVAGGLPLVFSEIKGSLLRWYHIFYLILGVLIVVSFSYMPNNLFELGFDHGFFGIVVQLIAGIIAAVALILPGISVSHMLYVLGIYQTVITAISSFEILKLVPFSFGVLGGVLLTSKMVEVLMERYKCGTYMLILGFVLGSVFELLNDVQIHSITITCLLLFFAGFLGMFLIFNAKKADA